MNDMGKILNSHTVRFERLLPGPIEHVWEHLTDRAAMAKWLCPDATMELKVNGRVDLKMGNVDPTNGTKHNFRGIVTECEAPHLIAYSWFETSSDLSSEVRFELEPKGDKVLLVLTHTRLSPDYMPKVGAGWHAHLDELAAILRGEKPLEFSPVFNELLKKYSALIAAGIVLTSAVSPAIAASDDLAYKALSDQRQVYLRNYDHVWKEADRIKDEINLLKRDTHADVGQALDDLDRELNHKYQDLRKIEADIRDLDKVAQLH